MFETSELSKTLRSISSRIFVPLKCIWTIPLGIEYNTEGNVVIQIC